MLNPLAREGLKNINHFGRSFHKGWKMINFLQEDRCVPVPPLYTNWCQVIIFREGGKFHQNNEQAGAELGQAQVKLDYIVVIVVEVVVKAMVEVEVQLLFRVGGGWSDKMKLILISTLVEVVVEVEVELGNILSLA